jgi:hypothetical protein
MRDATIESMSLPPGGRRARFATSLLFLALAACNNPVSKPAASTQAGAGTGPGTLTAGTSAAAGTSAVSVGGSAGSVATSAAGGGGGATSPVAGDKAAGSGGMSSGTGGAGGSGGASAPAPGTFINLAPPMGEPLDEMGKTLTPPAPTGWTYYEIAGSICRDGSTAGFFLHRGTEHKLMMFLEGGGACMNDHLCAFNQKNVNESFAGDGLTLLNSALGTVQDRQQPGVFSQQDHKGTPGGLFELDNPMNPMKGWSEIYVPYCSGDVHFGTKANGSVQGLSNQQFKGYDNMKLFISHIVPTFAGKLDRVILAGSSAGSLGALLNYSMVQDSFGSVPVDVIADSGLPFNDKYWTACLQQRYRDNWGFANSLPPDCTECKQADGGGLAGMADFLFRKHPKLHIAAISRTEDEIIRLFYSGGLNDCKNYDTLDPVAIVIGNVLDPSVIYPAGMYTEALKDIRDTMMGKGYALATMLIGAPNQNYHQLIFRSDFYTLKQGDKTGADFIRDFLNGTMDKIEP